MSEVLSIEIKCTDTSYASPSVVSIKCIVIDSTGETVDELILHGYIPEETHFETEGCVQLYWSTRVPELMSLIINAITQETMITRFHEFIEKHKSAIKCTDNEHFHVSALKALYEKYLPSVTPLNLREIHDVNSLCRFVGTVPGDIAHRMQAVINKEFFY